MSYDIIYLLLFAVATMTALVARRLNLPYTVSLVVVGLFIGNFNLIHAPALTKELLFSIFLPGLIFEAAFHIDSKHYWQNKFALHSLAFPGVVATIFLTAFLIIQIVPLVSDINDFSFKIGMLFGALVAATDPIAVVGLFKTIGVPQRLSVLLEGESLLNDGTSAVLFTLILSSALGKDSAIFEGATTFVYVVGVGALIGSAIGFCISFIRARVDDALIEITLTVLAAYGSFLIAEELHSSGIIATVASGMIAGNFAARRGMSQKTIIAVKSFWEYAAFALNSIIFLLIGLAVNFRSMEKIWHLIVIAYIIMTISRAAIIFVVRQFLQRSGERMSQSWAVVLTWGGLRGSLSMVLVLSIPNDFAPKTYLVPLTFGVVILSILIQGLTMSPLLRYLGLTKLGSESGGVK
jgi:CPA1 family monovalent cation:H+ antiporter